MDPTNTEIFEQVGLTFLQGQLIQVTGVQATVHDVKVTHQYVTSVARMRNLQQGGIGGLVIEFEVGASLVPKNPPSYVFGVLVNETLQIFALQFEEMLSEASLFFPNPQPQPAGIARNSESVRNKNLSIYLSVAGGVLCMIVFVVLGFWLRQKAASRRYAIAKSKRESPVLGDLDWSVNPILTTAGPTVSKSASIAAI